MLEQHGLALKVDSKLIIVPALLPQSTAALAPIEQPCEFFVQADFLPATFFGRALLRILS